MASLDPILSEQTVQLALAQVRERLRLEPERIADEPWMASLAGSQGQPWPVFEWEHANALCELIDPYALAEAAGVTDFIAWGAALSPSRGSLLELWLAAAWETRRIRFQDEPPSGSELSRLNSLARELGIALHAYLTA